MIAEAFDFLDGNGMPALVKSDIPKVEVERIEGIHLTKTTVASSMFVDLLPSKEIPLFLIKLVVRRFNSVSSAFDLNSLENS